MMQKVDDAEGSKTCDSRQEAAQIRQVPFNNGQEL